MIILDTNVLSGLMRSTPDPLVGSLGSDWVG